MCYDISYRITLETLDEYFEGLILDDPQTQLDFDFSIHMMAQAYQKALVVIKEDDRYHGKMFEWGLISKGMKTPDLVKGRRASMCNAQSERLVLDKQSAWHSIRHQRCLIPVNGIFEHRAIKDWKKKVPYYIQLKGRSIFCLPGLYNYPPFPQDAKTAELTGTFTIVTRAANTVMKQIHNSGDNAFRMPLFLPKELELKWLEPSLTDIELQEILDYEMPSEALNYHPVFSIRTSKPHPKGGLKTDPFQWANLPPLGADEIQQSLF